ncbi:MAG TPA: sodium:solute symporter family protein [Terriglobales bacterium]|nr:sodium:solute symporter family protein [Terriglobales bacterium]
MQLSALDWAVIVGYFALNLGVGLYWYRRASGSTTDYFVSGRQAPWWLAGTSLVATTFAADTPLVVTGLVFRYGIAGNWLWWAQALSGMLTVFFFARLWRRAGVITDMEFAELRYAGRPAAFLRGFRALYFALPVNTIILGWVNLAMAKILEVTLGIERLHAVMFCLALTMVYTTVSGLWAVMWTDLVQFALAMFVVIALAVAAVRAVGGMESLAARVAELDAVRGTDTLAFLPGPQSAWFAMFVVYLSVNWWASWYPGAEPGGGGYVAQRIFSAKDEKHSLAATLWFNLAHYALRPWPWILTALAAVVLYPQAKDPEAAYVQVMVDHLPASLRGLLLAGFAAAYMSTVSTHINLGASYLVNDFYRRFLRRSAEEQHYVRMSRAASVLVALAAGVATYFMVSLEGAWKFLIALGAGAGPVFMLRWFWWRINAWSEVAAMSAAAISSLVLQSRLATPLAARLAAWDPQLPVGPLDPNHAHGFAWLMVLTVSITTLAWICVTLATPPEPEAHLRAFYRRVRPASAGWRPIARLEGEGSRQSLLWSAADWIAGCALVYAALFGVGRLLFGDWMRAAGLLLVGLAAGAFIFWDLKRRGWETLSQ